MSTERKILLGFGLALLILLAIGLFSYVSIQDVAVTTSQVMRTHEVLENIKGVMSSVTDLQGTARGYVLTGKEEYLDPYRNAKGHLQRAVSELRRLTEIGRASCRERV